jgi:pyrroline-5-carboxylate reductase
MKYELGFIGCGNMGGALAVAAKKSISAQKIALFDKNEQKLAALAEAVGANALSLSETAQNSRFLVLGVKPQDYPALAKEISPYLNGQVLISMAAGVSIAAVKNEFGNLPVIRIMPNTPAKVGRGMILYATDGVSEQEEQDFLAAFAEAGVIDKLAEEKIDAASALSGCGPAFCYLFLQSLADGAVECGLSPDKAQLYAAQTMLGAAQMVLTYGEPIKRKDEVCSPGGTTIEGVKALEQGDLHGVAVSAVKASYHRTLELKK